MSKESLANYNPVAASIRSISKWALVDPTTSGILSGASQVRPRSLNAHTQRQIYQNFFLVTLLSMHTIYKLNNSENGAHILSLAAPQAPPATAQARGLSARAHNEQVAQHMQRRDDNIQLAASETA